jgi:hypothetical protein
MTCKDVDEVLKSLQPYVYIRGIIHSEEKVFSVTFMHSRTNFDACCPNYCQLTPKADWNGFCLAHFLCYGNGSPNEILSICLTWENWEM